MSEAHTTSVPQTKPPGDGWLPWCAMVWRQDQDSPYRHSLVEAWRVSWQNVEVLRVRDLHPAFNVAGLYWRPVSAPRLEPEVSL